MGAKVLLKKMAAKLKNYSLANWGFPFITLFLILLLVSVILVETGASTAADLPADIAYFSLLVGVILEIICFGKNRKHTNMVRQVTEP